MCDNRENITKCTGYYRCVDDIENFKIRIQLKVTHQDDTNIDDEWKTQEFSWQQKEFSKFEKVFYKDSNNCITDLEKLYNERIVNDDSEETIFYTYVNQDGFFSEHETFGNQNSYLETIRKIEHDDTIIYNRMIDYDYKTSILCSLKKKTIPQNWEKMYILADFGEFVEDLWIKNEQLLCIIKFDNISKVLSVYPNFTTTKPYSFNIHGETTLNVSYFLENCSSEFSESDVIKDSEIITKISECKQYMRKNIIGEQFFIPPKNKLYVYLFFEILSGKNFEHSDLYVQYYIDLPEDWCCENMESLKGISQRCHSNTVEGLMHFGHSFDVMLEYNLRNCEENGIPKTPNIYFEIISKTIWNCYRRDGMAYKNLPVSIPGSHSYKLACYRFDDYGAIDKLRRFFVGDCDDRDVKWIGIPEDHQDPVINKFGVKTVGTGELNFRVNVIHQSQAFLKEFNEGDVCPRMIYDKLKASTLIRSVNQVLLAFRKARHNMIEVRQNL